MGNLDKCLLTKVIVKIFVYILSIISNQGMHYTKNNVPRFYSGSIDLILYVPRYRFYSGSIDLIPIT